MRISKWLLTTWLRPAFGTFLVDEAIADTAAGSAPASDTPAAPAELSIPSTGKAYDEWRMSGKLPTATDDSAASDEANDDTETPAKPADTAADSAAAPAAGKKGKSKEDTERRFQELLAERKRDRERIAELERERTQPPRTATPPTSQPAAAAAQARPEPKIDDVDDKGQPKYKTLAEYLSDARKWDREQTVAEVERRNAEKAQQTSRAEHLRVIHQGWQTRIEAARKQYADFDAVALNENLKIPEGSVADAFVLDSEHGTDVLYYLGQHPEELEALSKLNPLRQARELFKIEQKVAKPAAPPAKKVTDAPRPPHDVSGSGRSAPDELEQAVKDGDEAGYFAAANRRDVARRKGK